MSIEVRPATRFDDVAAVVGPKNPASNVCFCLSYRIGNKENVALRGQARADRVREPLIGGAVGYARERGAPVVEGYPVDNRGERVNQTMAYVGTRALFESAGFEKAADTGSVLDGFPRVLMRLDLRP